MPNNEIFDVIIIGAAAAGLTAAIYCGRQGMNTLVIGKDLGGQALLASDIQNYPGFDNIDGFTLTSKFEEQAKKFDVSIIYDEVNSIVDKHNLFTIATNSKKFISKTVILAVGKTPRD